MPNIFMGFSSTASTHLHLGVPTGLLPLIVLYNILFTIRTLCMSSPSSLFNLTTSASIVYCDSDSYFLLYFPVMTFSLPLNTALSQFNPSYIFNPHFNIIPTSECLPNSLFRFTLLTPCIFVILN
jgi:hypothetical protein